MSASPPISFAARESKHAIEAVSYTHLDVYKRQLRHIAQISRMQVFLVAQIPPVPQQFPGRLLLDAGDHFQQGRLAAAGRAHNCLLYTSFVTIVMMLFTYNIANGLTAGLVVHPILKLTSGRARELNAGMIVLALLCAAYYLFGLPH